MEYQINNLRNKIREIILKESESIKEKKENDFDRVEYYLEYYKNLTPSDFSVLREDDKIIIFNIIK
jgi:hypothetical protein